MKKEVYFESLFWSKVKGPHLLRAFLVVESYGSTGHHVVRDGDHVCVLPGLSLFSYKAISIQLWGPHPDDLI